MPLPEPVAIAAPGTAYPGWWSVWRWVDGTSLDRDPPHDERRLATDLAAFVRAHHAIPTRGRTWNGRARGATPLADTAWVRTSIERSAHLVDPVRVTRLWQRVLGAPPHTGEAVFVHGDLMPVNLLVRDRRLTCLLDNGRGAFGDPAADLAPAWYLFEQPDREVYRDELDLGDATWDRARGWALETAIGGLHYYEHTNRVFFEVAERTLHRLLA